jgi:hypothetical protein
MRNSSFFWGSLIILLGILFLLDNLNILSINVWNLIWPVFLIVLGVWVLWGRFYHRPLAGESAVISLEGAQRAKVEIHHGAGRLDVHADGGMDNLLEGTFDGGLKFDTHREGDLLAVKMKTPSVYFPFWAPPSGLDWSLGLNRNLPLALDVHSGASEAHIDLHDLRVTDLRFHSGASATDLILPANAGLTRVEIEVGAASVNISVPDGVAARIRTSGGLSSISVDTQRFPRTDKVYQSPDYETAVNKVDLRLEVGVGSITLR